MAPGTRFGVSEPDKGDVTQHEQYHSAPGSTVGTPAYLAPEVIRATQDATYDAKVEPPTCLNIPLHAELRTELSRALPCSLRTSGAVVCFSTLPR